MPPLTPAELAMTRLARSSCECYAGLDYQFVKFVTSTVENIKKACDSIVMIWIDDGENRSPYFGRLHSLFRQVPPWVLGSTDEDRQPHAVDIAEVQWFATLACDQYLYGCPTVSRAFDPQLNGEFCFVKDLQPVPLALVPYLGAALPRTSPSQAWQVLTRDVAFFKPDIDEGIPPLE